MIPSRICHALPLQGAGTVRNGPGEGPGALFIHLAGALY